MTRKYPHSDSDQNSIESKLCHSSTSSQDSNNNNNNNQHHHHHHHHHNCNQTNNQLQPPGNFHGSSLISTNPNAGGGGSMTGVKSPQSSMGKKFGRRLTQAFAGLHAAAVSSSGNNGNARNSGASIAHGKNMKATKTLGVIMGCFILCWLPFFILAILRPFPLKSGGQFGDLIPRWLDVLLLWLGYFNSTLNPMIYARYNREFRRPFIEILCFR